MVLAQTDQISKRVKDFPAIFSSTEELASKIDKVFNSDQDKAKAAYAWIGMNIAYDTKALNKSKVVRFKYRTKEELERKQKQFRKELALTTMKRKKALCEGYSTLYRELCLQMGIECEIVNGTARRYVSEIGNERLPSNHAWNAVKLQNKWHLVDVTWGAGTVDYSKMKFKRDFSYGYFTSAPEEFLMKHYPDDSKWQLTGKKYSKKEFVNLPIAYKAFLNQDLKLISPKSGTLEMKAGQTYDIVIGNLPSSVQVAYHFKKERYGQKVEQKRKKGSSAIAVSPKNKGRDELIIYFDNEPALGFRVNVK
jgi:transglutaminase/protease-like cytokinesis protein 3